MTHQEEVDILTSKKKKAAVVCVLRQFVNHLKTELSWPLLCQSLTMYFFSRTFPPYPLPPAKHLIFCSHFKRQTKLSMSFEDQDCVCKSRFCCFNRLFWILRVSVVILPGPRPGDEMTKWLNPHRAPNQSSPGWE